MTMRSLIRKAAGSPRLHGALILAAVIAVYAGTLAVQFQADDEKYLLNNPVVNGSGTAVDLLRQAPETYKTFFQRIAGFATLALNYRLHGSSVAGYHLVNIAMHAGAALLLYRFVLLSMSAPFLRRSLLAGQAPLLALGSGLLFAVHPVQTEAVNYVLQRLAVQTGLLSLASLVAYAEWRLRQTDEGSGPGAVRRGTAGTWSSPWFAGAVLCSVLAMLTKENAFTLPFVVALYELAFFEGPVRKRLLHLAPVLATCLVVPLVTVVMMARTGLRLEQLTLSESMMTQPDYLITQIRVIATYLRLLFLPVGQNFLHHYPVFDSLLHLPVLASAGLLAGIVASAIWMFARAARTEPVFRFIAFGVLWFFIALSVESSLIALPHVMFEYRLYLPVAGIALATAGFAAILLRRRNEASSLVVLFLVLSLLLGTAAVRRNRTWKDNVSLWEDTVRKSPRYALAHINLGNAYFDRGRLEDALREYRTTVELNPGMVPGYYNLALTTARLGRRDEAMEIYRKALEVDPSSSSRYYNPLAADGGSGPREPLQHERRAEDLFARGGRLARSGQLDEALEVFEEVVRLFPLHAGAHYNIASISIEKGDYGRAIGSLRAVLKEDPRNIEARNNLAGAYAMTGQYEEARQELEEVLRQDPAQQDARYNLEMVNDALRRQRGRR